MDLPPDAPDAAALAREVSQVGHGLAEDAVIEAWVAVIGGRDPVAAVQAFRLREMRHRRRLKCFTDLDGGLDWGRARSRVVNQDNG